MIMTVWLWPVTRSAIGQQCVAAPVVVWQPYSCAFNLPYKVVCTIHSSHIIVIAVHCSTCSTCTWCCAD